MTKPRKRVIHWWGPDPFGPVPCDAALKFSVRSPFWRDVTCKRCLAKKEARGDKK